MQRQKRRRVLLDEARSLIDADRGEELLAMMTRLVDEADRLELLVEKLRKHRFGRRSERLDPKQLALVLAEIDARTGETPEGKPERIVDEGQPREGKEPKRERGKRKPLPESLPRTIIEIPVPEPAAACTSCGEAMPVIGSETSEVIDWVPGHFEVRRYVREKRACRCGQGGVVTAPAPDKVIDKGLPGAGLLAHVVVSKYQDHLPLYRQQQIFRRQGVDVSRATLGRWCAEMGGILDAIARAIRDRALAAHALQTDDTHIRVLDRDHPDGVRRGFLWAYLGDRQWASFDYTPSRSRDGPLEFMAGREGFVQADAYAGYDRLFEGDEARCREVGCWAHARRRFVEALESGDARAAWPLERIQDLYALERQATREALAPELRQKLRESEAKPLLEEIGAWLARQAGSVAPRSPLGDAIGYAQNQWAALCVYVEDGGLEIDNNAVERLMRMVSVGRKNYLFAGSDAGARTAAVLYTVIATCRLHGIDAAAYLADVVEQIQSCSRAIRLEELLPDAWLRAHPDAPRCPPPA